PPGWTIGNAVTRSPLVWNNNVFWLNDPNYTGGTGKAAEVSSSLSYRIFQHIGPYDTSLITPPIAVSTLPASPVLVYTANYVQNYSDALDLGISVDGGAWQPLLHWKENHGEPYGTPGEKVQVGLGSYIPSTAQAIRLRWRYFDAQGARDRYVQIDDVAIGAC